MDHNIIPLLTIAIVEYRKGTKEQAKGKKEVATKQKNAKNTKHVDRNFTHYNSIIEPPLVISQTFDYFLALSFQNL